MLEPLLLWLVSSDAIPMVLAQPKDEGKEAACRRHRRACLGVSRLTPRRVYRGAWQVQLQLHSYS